MITFLCAAQCQSCQRPVNVWKDDGRIVIRDRSMVESLVHLCADPDRRERIDMEHYEMLAAKRRYPWAGHFEMLESACPECGSQDVAMTTWGRWVDFPCSNLSEESWAEAWVGQFTEHVCRRTVESRPVPTSTSQPRYRTVDA